jgi:hypothetical protein
VRNGETLQGRDFSRFSVERVAFIHLLASAEEDEGGHAQKKKRRQGEEVDPEHCSC